MKKQESQFISFINLGPTNPLSINWDLHTPIHEGWVGRKYTALKSFPKTWKELSKSAMTYKWG